MGKGDRRTKRGKIFRASNGNSRPSMQKKRGIKKAQKAAETK
jgi:ribosomal small subunit protein bTHX